MIVTDASTGSPTRVAAGSTCRSRRKPSPTTFVAGFVGGSGKTVSAIESLRSVYRSSRLKNEKVTGSAYSTDAGGMIKRPAVSGKTTSCAMNRSIQRPPTCRERATPDEVAAGYAHTPSGVTSVSSGGRRMRWFNSRGIQAAAIKSTCCPL